MEPTVNEKLDKVLKLLLDSEYTDNELNAYPVHTLIRNGSFKEQEIGDLIEILKSANFIRVDPNGVNPKFVKDLWINQAGIKFFQDGGYVGEYQDKLIQRTANKLTRTALIVALCGLGIAFMGLIPEYKELMKQLIKWFCS